MEERWKIYKYGNLTYEVSDHGVIVGTRGRPLKTRLNEDGYEEVTLGDIRNRNSRIKVHRIVATLFVKNPFNKPEVNHIDCNRTNNVYSNLEWVTHSENIRHSWSLGHYKIILKQGEFNGRSRLSCKDVLEIFELLNAGIPATDIARRYGVGESTIYNIKYGNTWNSLKISNEMH